MWVFTPVKGARYRHNYVKICAKLNAFHAKGDAEGAKRLLRNLCENDLFFLGYFILGIKKLNHPWVVERILEVEDRHHRTVDLWAREHFKSTIITTCLTIQKILRNPEERIVIFSFTRQIAKGFLRRIKHTLEQNDLLKTLYDDIFFENPGRQAPKWSEDEGLIIKRRGQFNEATLEAWGIIDGMPTSKHYTIRIYDDLVVETSVATPDQMAKVKEAFRLSHALGSQGDEVRVIGTTYHFADLYNDLIDDGSWFVRKHPAEDSEGNPVYMSREELAQKRKDMGSYVYAAQMLLNPVAEENQVFQLRDLSFYRELPEIMFVCILVDPANEKKQHSDFTTIGAIGVDTLHTYYLLDLVRDKLSLVERWKAIAGMVKKWNTRTVGYEKYGMQSDIAYFEEKQMEQGLYFDIIPLAGNMRKNDRISRLVPLFETRSFRLPESLFYTDYQGKQRDLVKVFIEEEYTRHPFARHDDILDMLSRVRDEAIASLVPITSRPVTKVYTTPRVNPLDDHEGHYDFMAV